MMTNYFLNRNNKSLDSSIHNRTLIRWIESRLSFWGWVVISMFLIYNDVHGTFAWISQTTKIVTNLSTQLVYMISLPHKAIINLSEIFTKINHLRLENAQLVQENGYLKRIMFDNKQLAEENLQLRQMLNLGKSKAISYQTVEIISTVNTILNKIIKVQYGSKQGAIQGEMVIGQTSLVGRIYEIANNDSLVLPLTDVKSHIPVISEQSKIKGILAGNGSKYPEIINQESVTENTDFKIGETIFTSGDDGLLVPAIPIGVVAQINKKHVLIRLFENPLALEKVLIIKQNSSIH